MEDNFTKNKDAEQYQSRENNYFCLEKIPASAFTSFLFPFAIVFLLLMFCYECSFISSGG
jgi:hypothetical protein